MTLSLGCGSKYDLIIIIELKGPLVNMRNIYLMIPNENLHLMQIIIVSLLTITKVCDKKGISKR